MPARPPRRYPTTHRDPWQCGFGGDNADFIVARISPEGAFLDACRYGSEYGELVGDIAIGPVSAEVLLAASFWGQLDIRLGLLPSSSDGNMLFARLQTN